MIDSRELRNSLIPHSKPTLGVEESAAVSKVIASGHIAEGQMVDQYERAVAKFIGREYAAATNSGTSALHLTLLALDAAPGDEVIMPSYVCSALLNAVKYTGATAVPAEIAPDTYNLDVADAERRINRHTKAIILPHLFGLAAEIDAFMDLGVPVIEDCAQSIGATYHGRPVGSFGQAAIFSFYATKVITTAEGGMVTTDSREIDERVRDLKTYDQRADYHIRFNYPMTDIQAAMGTVQLDRLESIIRRRLLIAAEYDSAFSAFDLRLPPAADGHIYFRYVIGLEMDATPWIQTLSSMGVAGCRPVYVPIHRNLGLGGYPVTEKVWTQSLSIPIYPSLTDTRSRPGYRCRNRLPAKIPIIPPPLNQTPISEIASGFRPAITSINPGRRFRYFVIHSQKK